MINPAFSSRRCFCHLFRCVRAKNASHAAGATCCAALLCSAQAQNVPLNHPAAPEWKLSDLDGKSISLPDFKGKVVILDFWATWRAPCRDEIPGFVELQNKFGDRGLVVIGVSLDEGGAALVRKFTQEHKVAYPVVLGSQEVVAAYDVILDMTRISHGKMETVRTDMDLHEAVQRAVEVKPFPLRKRLSSRLLFLRFLDLKQRTLRRRDGAATLPAMNRWAPRPVTLRWQHSSNDTTSGLLAGDLTFWRAC